MSLPIVYGLCDMFLVVVSCWLVSHGSVARCPLSCYCVCVVVRVSVLCVLCCRVRLCFCSCAWCVRCCDVAWYVCVFLGVHSGCVPVLVCVYYGLCVVCCLVCMIVVRVYVVRCLCLVVMLRVVLSRLCVSFCCS